MPEISLKQKTTKGLLWGGMSNALMQCVSVLMGIIFLRMLSPSDYGKVSVLVVFSSVANILQESGFIAALTNRKEPTHEEYNAVFWFNIIVGIAGYVCLWFIAPWIAKFYREPILTPLSRYVFLGLIVSAVGTVQRAYLFGHLKVKQSSLISLTSLVLSGGISLVLICRGYAFWGLATNGLLYPLLGTILNWFVSPWRPTWHIDLRPAWKMFGFSSKLVITNLFNLLNSQVFSILLGRFYDTGIVGYYSNARKWNDMASSTINGMISNVAQPTFAQVREDKQRYHRVFRKMLRFTSFLSFPYMLGLALVAKEFILIVVGEKWIESASLLSLICIYGAFAPITTLYSNLAISQGKSGVNMFCIISLCVLVWGGLIFLHPFGVYAMVIFFVLINILWLLVWQWFAWRIVQLPFMALFKDTLPFLCFTLMALGVAWFCAKGVENIYFSILIKIVSASVIYLGITYASGANIFREFIAYLPISRIKRFFHS